MLAWFRPVVASITSVVPFCKKVFFLLFDLVKRVRNVRATLVRIAKRICPRGVAPDRREQLEGWRRRSWIYRKTGYLPALPSLMVPGYWPSPAHRRDGDDKPEGWSPQEYDAALEVAVAAARRHGPVLVATHPVLSPADAARQDRAGALLRERFAGEPGFEYLDLRKIIDLSAPEVDGKIHESLAQGIFRLLRPR